MGWSHLLAGALLQVVQAAPPPTPPVVGLCRFETAALSFAGSPAEQARCLMTPVGKRGVLGPAPSRLPKGLAPLLEGRSALPDKTMVARLLAAENMDIGGLDAPVSRARDGDPAAPLARYFVIHDTSTPYYGDDPFPADVDRDAKVNSFAYYFPANADPEKFPVAHLFLNRIGQVLVGQPLSRPWRATKLETRVIGLPAKGLFLHIETVMPRRRDPAIEGWNDAIAPKPGFSRTQYDRLALLYIALSVRAGSWLIPAQHATIDHGLPQAHDDPQNFRLNDFDKALRRRLRSLG
ncbi:hypothetical protein GGQ97_000830 [Sphingomonas kaistensis]|uniref:Uncharacterized protein n=1 Tax=Sphingomonas kaistensis TaxID=298708 RepID=A0A7X5Y4H3_9SPHN|nr:hypothetical protein [Sphingomonas kaistensis]NJC05037.1 hypothetical protein [Sphingomonas kaistensis]